MRRDNHRGVIIIHYRDELAADEWTYESGAGTAVVAALAFAFVVAFQGIYARFFTNL
jgi:hypothetical protein